MDGYQISEAARETGFSASALRFYEQQGIVVPERAANGYRSYDERAMSALRFIARAKRLGLSLEESTELLALLDEEDCDPVQARMQELVSHRIRAANDQAADLIAFTAELQRVADRLGTHTPDGPCDADCGCTSDVVSSAVTASGLPVLQPASPSGPGVAEISCSTDPAAVGDQLGEWRDVRAQVTDHDPIPGGMRLRFERSMDVVALSRLALAEQSCCGFFEFRIGISSSEITLEVTGPPETQDVIVSFLGP